MIHVILPGDIDDPLHPSGGNAYDREVCRGLRESGRPVREHDVRGCWPHPGPGDRRRLAALLAELPSGAVVLVDGLIASAAPGELAAEGTRLQLVVLAHMVTGDDPRSRAAEQRALASASTVVVTSRWTRNRLRELHDLPGVPVHVIEPGARRADLAPGTTPGRRFLSVGAVTRTKGADVLLEALGLVGDLSWRWVCVGPLDRDPEVVADLRRRAEALDVADRVTFTGPQTGDDLDEAYARADLLVLPSRTEAYGMVVTEALARGLPVVASDVGGVPEALGRNGIDLPGVLVPPGDPEVLAGALRRWLEDEGRRRRLRAAARERRDTLGSWERTSSRMARVLADVGAEREHALR